MVGLPWEQHVAFLDDRERARARSRRGVRDGVRACAGHPAVLCYAIGNEIPASIVRWHGRRRVERFLERLYRAAKDEDPDGARHLRQLPLDRVPRAAVPRLRLLQRLPRGRGRASRPTSPACRTSPATGRCVMAEIGLDSLRNGDGRAGARRSTGRCARAFAAGCAGAFVFSWTDEWHRGGHDDRRLGLRPRRPRAARRSRRWRRSRDAFAEAPFPPDRRLAAGLGRRLHLQRRAHAPRCLARPARARLPGLRGDRRRRRLDRRTGDDRPRVRLPR